MKHPLTAAWSVGLAVAFSFSATKVGATPVGNGDVNDSGTIDISDATYLLNWLFVGGPAPIACGGAAGQGVVNGDVDGNGTIDITDATYLLNWLFLGGPEPVPCGGPDAPHAVRPFVGHGALAMASFEGFCNGCHSIEPPSPLSAAPACTTCHTGGSPLLHTDCSSCHGNPPDGALPVGESYPNLPGAHAKHLALSSINGECDNCHFGGGSGTGLDHLYDGVVNQAAKDATYDAKAGTMVFRSDHTCRNVSCHGGIATPDWQSGSIAVTTDAGCARCHQAGSSSGQPEANSHYSGRHRLHRNEGIGCTTCHNMSGDENHFGFLDTPEIEGPVTFSNALISFDRSTRRCSGSCHGENHSRERW